MKTALERDELLENLIKIFAQYKKDFILFPNETNLRDEISTKR